MTQRKVSNPLALAALACLAEKPMHPYEIASTLRERHKDAAIKLNYGSLYAVMQSLCRHQLIVAQETLKDGRRPERTIFSLTEAGALELHDWLSELVAMPVKEFTQFEAGLSLLPVLPPAEALDLLRRRAEMLQLAIAHERSIVDYTQGKKLARLFIIDRDYRIAQLEAELAWTRALIAEIEAGGLDGLSEWRGFHADRTEPPPVKPRRGDRPARGRRRVGPA